MDDYMLTTVDNPIDPFENFVAWFKYDMILGHNTCGLLAELSSTSPAFSENKNNEITNQTMDFIVNLAPRLYKKVKKGEMTKRRSELVSA